MNMKKVVFLKNYIIEIFLNNDFIYFYDFKPHVKSVYFGKLKTQEQFEKGHLEDGCRIVWNEDMKLEDYEIFGFEIYESNLYVHSKDKYTMLCAEV